MTRIDNRKGVALSLSTVVVAVIILLVLVVVAMYFLSGFGSTGETITQTGEHTAQEGGDISTKLGEVVSRDVTTRYTYVCCYAGTLTNPFYSWVENACDGSFPNSNPFGCGDCGGCQQKCTSMWKSYDGESGAYCYCK